MIKNEFVTVSKSIRVARVLCIYFMMLVHVNPGIDNYVLLIRDQPTPILLLQLLSAGLLGRASVPLLSIISGYLAVSSLAKAGFWAFSLKRFKTLYIPVVFWNLLMIVFSLLVFQFLGSQTSVYEKVVNMDFPEIVFDGLMTLNYNGVTESLDFLRDLFVCSLLLPSLVYLAKKAPILSWLVLYIVSNMGYLEPLIYRPQILQFFYLGVIIHFTPSIIEKVLDNSRIVYTVFLIVLVLFFLEFFGVVDSQYLSFGPLTWFETVMRLSVAAAAWCFANWLTNTNREKVFMGFEKSIYLTYLSHSFVFGAFWLMWKPVLGNEVSNAYLIFFFGAPLLLTIVMPFVDELLTSLPSYLQIPIKGKVTMARG